MSYAAPPRLGPPAPPAVALQLYTVRADLERDAEGTLAQVAAAGYAWVEWFGGLRGRRAGEWRRILDRCGLRMLAAHVPLDSLCGELGGLLDDYQALECRTLVCPFLAPELRGDAQVFRRVGERLNLVGYELRARGFRLAYHNHDFEFAPHLEPDGLRQLLHCASHDGLGAELDVFWLAWAGRDPATELRDLGSTPGRVRLVHLKDGLLPPPAERSRMAYDNVPFRPLGQGDLAMDEIVRTAVSIGAEGLIVEQDFCQGPPLAAARQSLAYLHRTSLGRPSAFSA